MELWIIDLDKMLVYTRDNYRYLKFREEGIAIGEVKSLIKTTTALNLGYALSEKGIKVLLIDFDPQSSLTSALGYDAENKENIQTLMILAIEEEEIIGRGNYILNIKENLDLIPCSLELSGIEMGLVNVNTCNTRVPFS